MSQKPERTGRAAGLKKPIIGEYHTTVTARLNYEPVSPRVRSPETIEIIRKIDIMQIYDYFD